MQERDGKTPSLGNVTTRIFAPLALIVAIAAAPFPIFVKLALGVYVAILGLMAVIEEDSRMSELTAAWLSKENFNDAYLRITARPVFRLRARYAYPTPRNSGNMRSLRAALTTRLYDRAMLIAVAYPLLLLLIPWIFSGDVVKIGGATIVPSVDTYGASHIIGTSCIFLSITSVVLRISKMPNPVWTLSLSKGEMQWTLADLIAYASYIILLAAFSVDLVPLNVAIAFAIAGCGAVSVALAFEFAENIAGAVAFLGAVAFATTLAVAGEVAFAKSFFFAFVIVVLAAALLRYASRNGHRLLAYSILTIVTLSTLLLLALSVDWQGIPELYKALFIFFGFFPLINAIFDTFSYAISLSLIRRGLRIRKRSAVGLALLDLFEASLLFFLLGAALIFGITTLNFLAEITLFPLNNLFQELKDSSQSDSTGFPLGLYWVPLMVFSTLIPTSIHFLVALVSLQTLAPERFRCYVADCLVNMTETDVANRLVAVTGGALIITLPVIAIGLILWLISKVLWPVLSMAQSGYLKWLSWIGSMFGL
ncbi:hypothetical protein SAMN05428995_102440 [Loktanella sp. DSM 29012]|uniref:hypothetical protein n=1 Tax=Loktanella sp. DSM 29012 TaxID=1881056 RepID=UPI0008D4CBEF|nr:hypothetical protein [Loktanella sp. DSM 29012]SEQ05384.1 hypothetical protein SAMN05428995_102440 [Loktanella sp. DSM 29012]